MSNPKPNENNLYRQKARWVDAQGKTIKTKTARLPEYLLPQLLEIADQLHQSEITKNAEA